MTEEDDKIQKTRLRMENEVYSVLLSHASGATPEHLERWMEDNLGYSYVGKYHLGGVRSMEQLLMEHRKVKQLPGRKFQIIPREEVAEMADLISKQKKKNPRRPKARPTTATGHRFGGFGVKSPTAFRPLSVMTKNSPKKYLPNFSRPSSSAAMFVRSTSALPGFAAPVFRVGATQQRPLLVPKSSFSQHSTQPAVFEAERKSETLKSTVKSSIPSIKEFSDNTKKMLLNIHPKSVHLSEMTEMYSKEYGCTCDPLQLFSKSWKMLAMSTFKEWMETKDEFVVLNAEWAQRNAVKPMPPPVTLPMPPRSSQGFRFKENPTPPTSPTEIVQRMRGLTVGARQALRTPELPPGIKPQPDLSVRPKTAATNLSKSLQKMLLSNHQYDAHNLLDLRDTMKEEVVEAKVHEALCNPSDYPGIKQAQKSTTPGVQGNAFNTYRSTKTPSSSKTTSLKTSLLSAESTVPSGTRHNAMLETFRKAVTAIKKEAIETPIPRRGAAPPKSLYVTQTPQTLLLVEKEPTAVSSKPSERFVDNWKELHEVKKISESPHKPLVMPPMSRAPGIGLPSRFASTSQHNKKLFEQALASHLPDSEDEPW